LGLPSFNIFFIKLHLEEGLSLPSSISRFHLRSFFRERFCLNTASK